MKCASCGKQNPHGARYCVQCGVEQALPAPMAAVAAGAGTGRVRVIAPQAANAPQAGPDTLAPPNAELQPGPWQRSRTVDSSRDATVAKLAAGDARLRGSVSNRAVIGATLAVAIIALAVALFAGWRSFHAGADAASADRDDESVMAAFPPEATPRPRRQYPANAASTQPGTAARESAPARD